MRARRLIPFAAILVVIAAYVYIASGRTWEFRRAGPMDGHYANLAEGFRRGQLSMAIEPKEELKRLPNPYSVDARNEAQVFFVWDASYYEGRYYLYFTPLPVLGVYIPFRILAGGYPRDALVAVAFATWALIAAVAFARRFTKGATQIPFALWVLFLGLGNVVPLLLTNVRHYEVVATLAMALTATWAYALLRFDDSASPGHAFLVGLVLALAIVTRPNLALLLVVTAVVIWRRSRMAIVSVLIPLAVIGSAAAWYNVARFGNVFEFGMRYQLNAAEMLHVRPCGVCSRVFDNILHYLFWWPSVSPRFPFVHLQPNALDPAVSYPSDEPMIGIVPLMPLVVIGSAIALLVLLRRRTEFRAGVRTIAAGWLNLVVLTTCFYVVPRFLLDFTLLLAMGSVACIEAGARRWPLRVLVIAFACWSIALGLLLGFTTPQ